MPKLIIMVGLPGSGKSTLINELLKTSDSFVYSTDDYIEEKAKEENSTYTLVFDKYVKEAHSVMNERLKVAVGQRKHIIWDQTNLTKKKRKLIIQTLPGHKPSYICILPPQNEEQEKLLAARLKGRANKNIPSYVIENMRKSFEEPTGDEGFDGGVVMEMVNGRYDE